MKQKIRIATRQSALALWQTQWVTDLLRAQYPDLEIEWVPLTTVGDRTLDTSLAKIGGKGLFLKELETALLSHQADLAVHSLKDCPMENTPGLHLSAFLPRATPQDALLAHNGHSLFSLPLGARLGTSSLRRQSQIKAIRPDLNIQLLRGNVDTRVKKWLAGDYDAIVLAACGLERLGLASHITEKLPTELMLPAIGQGVVVIQTRQDDPCSALVQPLHDAYTAACAHAERALGADLGSHCHVPVAGWAHWDSAETLLLKGFVGNPDGTQAIYATHRDVATNPQQLGREVAKLLRDQGADQILAL